MFKTISNAWKQPEIRKRLLYTLLLLIVFRFGSHITVPFVDIVKLNQVMEEGATGLLGLVDAITGGGFSRLSIFAMSISPYISASIIVQLLGMIIPSIEAMIKEGGDYGKQKIAKYTKIIAFILAGVQGAGIYLAYSKQGIFTQGGWLGATTVISSMVAGTAFLIWLADKITSRGIGNGTSMLIFAGIVSSIPGNIHQMLLSIVNNGQINIPNLITVIGIVIGALIMIAGVVYVQTAERRVPVQYAKKVVGRKMYGGQNTHIPLKLVMAGVMPVIFASAFISFPALLIQLFRPGFVPGQGGFLDILYNFSVATSMQNIGWGYTVAHMIVYLLLIVGFTFFYTFATFNPAEISTNLKQNGGFVPGIRAGKATTEFLTNILVNLTWFGALFLGFIAILPMLTRDVTYGLALSGTSILIVVGVALETVQQLESFMVMRNYKGFLN